MRDARKFYHALREAALADPIRDVAREFVKAGYTEQDAIRLCHTPNFGSMPYPVVIAFHNAVRDVLRPSEPILPYHITCTEKLTWT